ncbi:MAG: AsmA family protein, partial [Pseudomonadota bacterium]
MRVLLWIVAIPVVLIALLAVLIPLFLDEKALVDLASEQIQEQTGAILRVEGDASFSLFPEVGIAASKVSVDVPDSKATIDAESLSVGVALMPLFSRTVDIKAIRVEGMTVTQQAANEDAAKAATLDTSTFSDAELDAYYAARDQARATAQAEAAASVLAVPLALEVGELALRDIRLITVDSEQQPISELQLKDFTATDMNIGGRPIPLNAHIVVPGEDAAPPIEVQIAGEVEAAINDNLISLNGLDIEVTGATPDPVTVSMAGEFSLTDQVATLDIRLEIGEMTGEGSVRYASFESPQIDADLSLTELNPALLVLAGPEAAETVAAAETEAPAGGETPLPLDTIRAIDTRAILSIDTVVVEPHVLTDVEATLRVVDGVVRLEPVSATVYEGEIDFQLVLDGRYNNANLATSGGVSNLSFAPAAEAMDVGIAASGEANLSFDLSGSGKTVEDLQGSMTGPI